MLQEETGIILLGRLGSDNYIILNHVQGFNLFGHCLLLVIFVLSLVLIVALMYWMVS